MVSIAIFTSLFWWQVTSGGFTSVAAFEAEYSRRGQNEVMEKRSSFYKESSNCVKPLLHAVATQLQNHTK
ncbi:MAG: hypothetical protein CFE23_16495 [Flavobacterium sp. BFFFF1]|nr:MAG: hypothetical protein CFE23_16495 [Flavobacterium sp. BFFFF1]